MSNETNYTKNKVIAGLVDDITDLQVKIRRARFDIEVQENSIGGYLRDIHESKRLLLELGWKG